MYTRDQSPCGTTSGKDPITLLLGGTTHTLHYQETVCHTGAWARRDASEPPLVLTSVVPSHPIERFVQGRRTALR